MIAEYMRRRRVVKLCREWLQHSRLCRKMRADIAHPDSLHELVEAEKRLQGALRTRDVPRMERECGIIQRTAVAVMPRRSFPGLRENVEVIAVALAVAMAFRCYILQPFKIPTGSMQPTLYGIHYVPDVEDARLNGKPWCYLRWLLFGQWHTEIKAETSGRVRGPLFEHAGHLVYDIGGLAHPIPREMTMRVDAEDEVIRGQVIACGMRISGDHLFVNRVKWNFIRPRRGEIMVFRTENIPALDDKKTHYIKRMCALPGDSVQIMPPNILVNGKPVEDAPMIQAIQNRMPGYNGYITAEGVGAEYLAATSQVRQLGPRQYLACGDNTRNSFDGRYWGPVPEQNLVGPAAIVYWPISKRWGLIR